MIATLLKLLGLGQGASLLNNVSGIANHATLVGAFAWAWSYRADPVTVKLTVGTFEAANFQTSVGACVVLAAALWFMFETARRSRGPGRVDG